jgi:biotin operon repressor
MTNYKGELVAKAIERCLWLVNRTLREPVSAKVLCAEQGIARRTLWRDVARLRDAGHRFLSDHRGIQYSGFDASTAEAVRRAA